MSPDNKNSSSADYKRLQVRTRGFAWGEIFLRAFIIFTILSGCIAALAFLRGSGEKSAEIFLRGMILNVMFLPVLTCFSHKRLRSRLAPYWFLLPAILIFAMFSWRPIIYSFWVSLLDFEVGSNQHKFVGLDNFRYVLTHKDFVQMWINVGVFVGLSLLIGYAMPIALAITINEMRRAQWWFRLGFYLPVILPLVVVALMWKFLYQPYEGLFDSMLRMMGLDPVEWLQNEKTAMLSLVIMSTWKNVGGAMIIYLAALQGVPSQLYEAAEIDGATVRQRLRFITIPSILPIMMILFILQIIGTFQVFVEPFLMTSGGPNHKTYTPLYFIYDLGFTRFDYGAGSAMGLILFFVLLIFTVIYFRLQKKVQS